jgi:hypothetical protein
MCAVECPGRPVSGLAQNSEGSCESSVHGLRYVTIGDGVQRCCNTFGMVTTRLCFRLISRRVGIPSGVRRERSTFKIWSALFNIDAQSGTRHGPLTTRTRHTRAVGNHAACPQPADRAHAPQGQARHQDRMHNTLRQRQTQATLRPPTLLTRITRRHSRPKKAAGRSLHELDQRGWPWVLAAFGSLALTMSTPPATNQLSALMHPQVV